MGAIIMERLRHGLTSKKKTIIGITSLALIIKIILNFFQNLIKIVIG